MQINTQPLQVNARQLDTPRVPYGAHNAARQELRRDTGGRDINIGKILTTPKLLKPLLTFVARTGRWKPQTVDAPHQDKATLEVMPT